MKRSFWLAALAAGICLLGLESAEASRTPTVRTSGDKSSGARSDITVPYLTTGKTTFMSGTVAPSIYSSPIVDDPANPQTKPVYNIIFYGSKQSFGSKSNGATPREK